MKENQKKFNAFKHVGLSDWETAAREELAGANPWEKLVHQREGWSIRPYYDRNESDCPPLLPISKNKFLGARTWYNCPHILVADEKKANEDALLCLRQGADGILFELQEQINFDVLLEGIQWQHCSLNFLAKRNKEAFSALLQRFLVKKKIADEVLPGAFFGNQTAPGVSHGPFRFAGFEMMAARSPVDEIVQGFKTVQQTMGKDFVVVAGQVAFSVNISHDFFLELAKLRAIRQVWNKYLVATKAGSHSLLIHAHSRAWSDQQFQPHENMIKSTTAALAAILGGCDALTIDHATSDLAMTSRVAQNVSSILREESYLSKVADPVAGSYFIENLTHQLTDAAWESIHLNVPK